MKAQLIFNALNDLAASGTLNADDLKEVNDGIQELLEVMDNAEHDGDEFMNDVVFLQTGHMMDFMNIALYDNFGKLMRQSNGLVTTKDFCDMAREDFSCLTSVAAGCSYHFLLDLWSDNQRAGNNNPDGTFKK